MQCETRLGTVHADVVYSPDDGGWYGQIDDANGTVHQTDIVATRGKAVAAVSRWLKHRQPKKAKVNQ